MILDKTLWRKRLLDQRLALQDDLWQARSTALVKHLQAFIAQRNFSAIIIYRSFRREPDLSSLAQSLQPKLCYYPKVEAQELHFYPSPALGPFVTNKWGLEEPKAAANPLLVWSAETLLVIPGVAFDKQGFRLGYGGGYFDRLLAQHQPTTLGVCFDDFLVDQLPREAHDIPMQFIATESGLRSSSANERILT